MNLQEGFFASSDSLRNAGSLSKAKSFELEGPLRLHLGGILETVALAYETYGELSRAKDNAVLICHALSGDSHVARHGHDDLPGWWEIMVGPGKAIDTNKYFVICANVLGGCRGTTGPGSLNPATERPYGGDFPRITMEDMVEVQRRLVEHLGITRLLAVVGGSMGGMMALQWAISHPEMVHSTVLLATTSCLSSQALAFDVIGRNAIFRDPHYNGGQYYDEELKPDDGLAIARMIGHVTYLSGRSMAAKFDPDRERPRDVEYDFEKEFSVGSYLAYQGGRFVERFDANSYVTLSLAMDRFNLARDYGSVRGALERAKSRFLVVSFSSDWLFPPAHSRRLVEALLAADKEVSYVGIESDCGHDAFLLEQDLPVLGPLVSGFLTQAAESAHLCYSQARDMVPLSPETDARSIFYRNRLDLERIEGLIPPGAGVLDLGCGTGELLCRLKERGHRHLLGLELSLGALQSCVSKGLNVVRLNLDEGLKPLSDKQFDVVVLSQTLQALRRPDLLLLEMLRVGEIGVVSFPNFACRQALRQLLENGVLPVTEGLPFPWYSSPYIRFCSIKDFENLCQELKIKVHKLLAIDSATGREITDSPNQNADTAIFVLSRQA